MFDYIVAFDCVALTRATYFASKFLRLSFETVCSLATVFVSLKRYVKRKTLSDVVVYFFFLSLRLLLRSILMLF